MLQLNGNKFGDGEVQHIAQILKTNTVNVINYFILMSLLFIEGTKRIRPE